MRNNFLEAYHYFKSVYNSDVVLFHIGVNYYAFQSDVLIVSRADDCAVFYSDYDENSEYEWCGFHESELGIMCCRLLHVASASVTVVEYRGGLGAFAIPKVKQILQDIDSDY